MDTDTQTHCPSARRGRVKRYFRYWHLRIVRIQATPHAIAMGLAAGVFAGLLPIIPVQTVLALTLAFFLRGSKLAAVLGTWISNPLNVVPQYMLCYFLGGTVMPFELPPFVSVHMGVAQMLGMGWPFFVAMLSGGLLLAFPGACITYVLAFKGVRAYRLRRQAASLTAG